MELDNYKKYTKQAKSGIKGEAFFELLLADYALPHRVVGPKDIGIDYFCEWVLGDKPTGVLFIVQVKTFTEKNVKPFYICVNEKYNGLEEYEIRHNRLKIEKKTLQYWKGLGIPSYLFVMVQKGNSEEMNCFYRRYTPLLTSPIGYDESGEFYQGFYKVNRGTSFLAFRDSDKRIQGFTRDLFIDHVRYSYAKGQVIYPEPKSMGLNQFERDSLFRDLFEQHEDQIRLVYNQTGSYLKAHFESRDKH